MFFEGYGKFFGIEAYAYINITMAGTEIYVWGKAWDLIYTELFISAGYDVTSLKDAHFYVRVIVDLRKLTAVSWSQYQSISVSHTIHNSQLNWVSQFMWALESALVQR